MKVYSLIYLAIYLFIFTYTPPILNINILHFLSIYSLLAIVLQRKNVIQKVFIRSGLLEFTITLFASIVYLALVLMFTSGQIIELYGYMVILTETVLCSMYVILYCINKQIDIHELLNAFLMAGLAQALLAILAFLHPEFQEMLLNIIGKGNVTDTVASLSTYRLFGLSTWLTYSTPIVQTYLSIVAIMLFLENRKAYLLCVPVLFFSAVINARISFIILGVGLFCIMLVSLIEKKYNKRLLILLSITILLFAFMYTFLDDSSLPLTFSWIIAGFGETESFFAGERVGYFDVVFNHDFFRLPEGLGVIFGTGEKIFGSYSGSSDVGYINDIWLGGIIFSLMIYFSFIRLFMQALRSCSTNRAFPLFVILSFLVANFKGSVVYPNEIIQFSVLCCAAINVLSKVK